ncbi:MAG TPA: hypothetical protein VFW64_22580 [Pseudonocardiaceae bacterium]|nr:hypothetical protein [Pseudonocardiaceae bacterium]
MLAATLLMLDIGAFRIGGDEYTPGSDAGEATALILPNSTAESVHRGQQLCCGAREL